MAASLGERDDGDLTARARIRDAALRLFAERGVEGVTIREIAEAAGVSGGLVRHHFVMQAANLGAWEGDLAEGKHRIEVALVVTHDDNPAENNSASHLA